MSRRPDVNDQRGSALVIAIVMLTMLMGLAVSVDLAVNRTVLQVREYEMRTRLDLITESTAVNIVDAVNGGVIPLEPSQNLVGIPSVTLHDAVKEVELIPGKTRDQWYLIIRSVYREGPRRVLLNKMAHINCETGNCRILNINYL